MPKLNANQILKASDTGSAETAQKLLPLVYAELRELARSCMAAESADHTLQATALVHEAYVRLIGNDDPGWQNRGHFFAAAAQAMRRILVDHARSRGRLKRGGKRLRLELLDQPKSLSEDPSLILSLDELLGLLSAQDTDAARVADLHLFGGLSVEQAGDALKFSRAVAYRNWKYARAWLREALEK